MLNIGDRVVDVSDGSDHGRTGTIRGFNGDTINGEVLDAGDNQSVYVFFNDRTFESNYVGEWHLIRRLQRA